MPKEEEYDALRHTFLIRTPRIECGDSNISESWRHWIANLIRFFYPTLMLFRTAFLASYAREL
jgi:hypothetical protein